MPESPASGRLRIGELTLADLPEIVRVHMDAFPTSATTRLGEEVVRRYYEWQFLAPHQAHYLGAWESGGLGGFCICGRFQGALGGFLARNQRFLTRRLLLHPWLCLNEEVLRAARSALRIIFTRRRSPALAEFPPIGSQSSSFGILSIAVSPSHRRLGLGARLMTEAEKRAHELGYTVMGLTVNPRNTSAILFYEKLGWTRKLEQGRWRGAMVNFLVRSSSKLSAEADRSIRSVRGSL